MKMRKAVINYISNGTRCFGGPLEGLEDIGRSIRKFYIRNRSGKLTPHVQDDTELTEVSTGTLFKLSLCFN
jgi:hypothetical protein